jgi:hypothetical protein
MRQPSRTITVTLDNTCHFCCSPSARTPPPTHLTSLLRDEQLRSLTVPPSTLARALVHTHHTHPTIARLGRVSSILPAPSLLRWHITSQLRSVSSHAHHHTHTSVRSHPRSLRVTHSPPRTPGRCASQVAARTSLTNLVVSSPLLSDLPELFVSPGSLSFEINFVSFHYSTHLPNRSLL